MRKIFSLLVLATCFATPALAQIGHTDMNTFIADVPLDATITLEDFEGQTVGSSIFDGDTINGFELDYLFGDGQVTMQVFNEFSSAFGTQYVGTDDGGLLQDGDDFSVIVEPSNSFGIYFLTKDALLDGDINLSFNGVSVDLVNTDFEQVLADGSFLYFMGVTNNSATDTTAFITTLGDGVFLYNYDDLIRVVNNDVVLLGDVNLDGAVNLLDVGPFVDLISAGGFQAEADINQDDAVNLLDVGPFVAILAGG